MTDLLQFMNTYPLIFLFLALLGGFSLGKGALKTIYVFAQTFLLPGTSVRGVLLSAKPELTVKCTAKEVWCRKRCMGRSVYGYSKTV